MRYAFMHLIAPKAIYKYYICTEILYRCETLFPATISHRGYRKGAKMSYIFIGTQWVVVCGLILKKGALKTLHHGIWGNNDIHFVV